MEVINYWQNKKAFLVILFIFLSLSSKAQDSVITDKDIPFILAQMKKSDAKSPKVYNLNLDILEEIIQKGETTYYLVASYAYWCIPCVEELPELLKFTENNQDVTLILFNTDKEKDFLQTKKRLNKVAYYKPTFTVNKSYAKGRKKRLDNFLKAMCASCDFSKAGMSAKMLFNKKSEVLFNSNYEMKQPIEKIKKIVNP